MWLDKVNILLVDDHEPNLIALEQILENPALDIHRAFSGQEALEMMLEHEYAIVLLDVNMPEMDGFEVAKLTKARKETRNLPICFVTAVNREEKYAIQGYETGAVDYLYKPLDPDVINAKVSVFVELFRLRKQSESRLNAIQSSMDGIAILNHNLFFLSANPSLLEMTSYQEEDLIEKPYRAILDEKSDIILQKEIRPALDEKGKWQGELHFKRADGSIFPVGVSLNDTENAIICIARDITERKAQEEEMRMLHSVVENANDIVIVTDAYPLDEPHGPKIRYVNKAFERTTGYTKEEVIGKTPRFLQGENTDKEQRAALKESLQKGEEARMEVLNYAKNGYEYYNDIRIVPVKNKTGEVEYFTAIQRDTTARRNMEEDLKNVNKELETLTYITSHDLRAPLVSLKGFCGELEEALEALMPAVETGLDNLSEKQKQKAQKAKEKYLPQSLKYIKQGTERLSRITDLLLDLSRTGRRNLHFDQVNVHQTVQNCLDSLNHQIKERGAEVILEDLPDIIADQSALEQIFANILDNAVKYLDPNRPGQITVRGQANPMEATYEIKDNGRGIAKDQMHKVFEVFRRAGDVTDVPGEGMGIAFIKALVKRHGGRLWCESEYGKGTTFFFTIARHLKPQTVEQEEAA